MRKLWVVFGLGLVAALLWAAYVGWCRFVPRHQIVAVPALGDHLLSPTAPSFAAARYFVIVDVTSGETKVVPNPSWQDKQALGIRSSTELLDQGVGAVLTPSIAAGAANNLHGRGVAIYTGEARTPQEALQRFAQGQLARHVPVAPEPSPAAPPVIPTAFAAPAPQQLVAPAPLAPAAPGSPQPGAVALPELGIEVLPWATGEVFVYRVQPGTRAAAAGLAFGDTIKSVGGVAVDGVDALLQAVRAQPAGQPLPFTVLRQNQLLGGSL